MDEFSLFEYLNFIKNEQLEVQIYELILMKDREIGRWDGCFYCLNERKVRKNSWIAVISGEIRSKSTNFEQEEINWSNYCDNVV